MKGETHMEEEERWRWGWGFQGRSTLEGIYRLIILSFYQCWRNYLEVVALLKGTVARTILPSFTKPNVTLKLCSMNEIRILHLQSCYCHVTYSVSCVTLLPFINPLPWNPSVHSMRTYFMKTINSDIVDNCFCHLYSMKAYSEAGIMSSVLTW